MNFQINNIFLLVGALCLSVLLNGCFEDAKSSTHSKVTFATLKPAKDSITTSTLCLVGDLMCHKPQTNHAKKADGTYDFRPSFELVKPYLSDADLTIGNLELTLAGSGKPYSGYPAFNAPDEYIDALTDAGFDFLVTANNHSMDTGEEGLQRTLKVLKEKKVPYAGTFSSQSDHDSIRVVNINGIKLAVLNYTYGTNGAYPKAEHHFMLNIIDSATITNEVKKAKAIADVVLVFYHYGIENLKEPNQSQLNAVRYAKDAGAHLIIGAHPHVVGPTALLPSSEPSADSVFVAYSLGNFISNQYWRYTDAGVILKIHLEKNHTTNKVKLNSVEYMPTWVYRAEKEAKKCHVIFPSEYANISTMIPSYLDSALVLKMREAFEDTKMIIEKYHANVKLWEVKKP